MKWIHDPAVDLIRSNTRRRDRNLAWQSDHHSPFASTDDPDANAYQNAVWNALQELPIDQRSVVHLRLWSDCTFEMIAAMLDISINTAASRYRYGLDKMRERLRPLYEEIKDCHGQL